MTTATSPRLAGAGADTCRLTVAGPAKRADLAVPATTTMAELLPVMLQHVVDEAERNQPWVLQRLGGEPLDAGGTVETLDLRDGDILYLRTTTQAMPAAEFDDIAVGVADSVGDRSGRPGPATTRGLLLGAACVALAAFTAGCFAIRPGWLMAPALGAATVFLLGGCVLATRALADTTAGMITGLWGCAFAALAGLSGSRGAAGILAPTRPDVLLAGALAMLAAVAGAWLALAFHWDPVRVTAVLAVAGFIAGTRAVRIVLRAAQIRVPQLPRTAEELQQDIEPEPASAVARRTARAVGYLDSFTVSSAAVFVAAFAVLARSPGWAGWVLSLLLSGAVLLRARETDGIWQRTALVLSGAAGTGLVLLTGVARGRELPAAVLLAVLLGAGVLLVIGAGRLPGRRQAPIWGHLAEQLETVTALALVPLLLQLLHVYAYFRSLIG
jgi:type VII secretion integral membrane protein EccD